MTSLSQSIISHHNLNIVDYVKHPDYSFKLKDITVILVNTIKYLNQDEGNSLCNKFYLSVIMHAH